MLETLREFGSTVLYTFSSGVELTVARIAAVILLLVAGYLLSRLVGYLLRRRLSKLDLRPDVVQLLSRVTFYAILAGVVLTALSLLNIPLTAFAFVSGAIAIGVGFGAQNIINNFISGWILMTERPIRIGDFIEMDDFNGVVERIGNRSTRIRRTDGVHMLVPNSQLLERTVINWTLIDREIRSTVRVGVAYGSDVRLTQELMQTAIEEHEATLRDPKPVVMFEDFGDNALIFDGFFWCEAGGERELRQVRSDIRFRIAELLDENDIVVAFPQRDVHLDATRPVPVQIVEADK